VTSDPEGVRVDVADRGPGVPAEDAERIFEPFYRVPGETSRSVKGTGLGLAVSRSIVEAHGGRLWYEPNPGGGALFRFTLPVS
jgi:signal transduction histidine kinase